MVLWQPAEEGAVDEVSDVVREAQANFEPGRQADLAIAIAKDLPADQQERVVTQGIDKSAWPQESKDRRLTITYSVIAAVLVFALVGVFDVLGGTDSLVTGGVAIATAIVGGIFGYAKQT
jgi:hypothetical protein